MKNNQLKGFRIFLFGSALHSQNYNDIDLLIEYDEKIIDINKAISFRKFLAYFMQNHFHKEIDICLLSKSENKQSKFIERENGKLLTLIT